MKKGFSMRLLPFTVLLFLVHCGFKRIETECGCEKRDRRQYQVTAQVQGDRGFGQGAEVYRYLLELVDRERRRIYGICLENISSSRERIIFCADDRREYEELEDRFRDVSFRAVEMENSLF